MDHKLAEHANPLISVTINDIVTMQYISWVMLNIIQN